jgi:glycosyltransferase involved in cell wall biosynthesis
MAFSKDHRLVMVLTEDWFFLSHFLQRGQAAVSAGYQLTALANDNGCEKTIAASGVAFQSLKIKRSGLNPIVNLRTLLALLSAYRRLRPTLVHHVGLKPILLGSIAARLLGIRAVVNAPVGMGYLFSARGGSVAVLRSLVTVGLRVLLNPKGSRVIVENSDDLNELAAKGIARLSDLRLVRGAGVDVTLFRKGDRDREAPVVVVLVARMLWSKGVGDFVAAARRMRELHVNAIFQLVGGPDPENPQSLSEDQLRQWHAEGVIEWLGYRHDVPGILADAQIACLPSYYREGLPKSLLEAMAASLPIVTTDAPGCREAVENEVNGLLVPPRDIDALVGALRRLVADAELRARMGNEGRKKVEREFRDDIVVRQTLDVYGEIDPISVQ